ncbi:MAG: hypothetical protein A2534_00390 [Candidatus Magasanikbacteria bacterium RIFOXYD2_FULL_39_9]|uniref:Leucine--tRNA ligase n=1 Tax=Candidatus Magasanikbacteria bacterium RIFOXYD1_FULL_40_23 TaxID=1798705 RepID=A0A1F6P9D2_9BACT|nr:MAG: hypothetical protein A2534_00390 [Candidatus Magasanikbacteria bacterium RIFOXYD2_FULL_39_9]OGH92787.1 MAG: hypothetical protein A2563_03910 [Candidatus Magasanikbacteria bacterium RIFOXYD1_FULL_40_23]
MQKYDPKKIEKKWQKYWEKNKTFEVQEDAKKDKFYSLIEFPYPSGEGLHVGHPRPFTAMDVISRKKRMEGKNVLFPIGFDAFGLPTENFAIKTGKPPAEVTKKNIANFTRQLKMLGFSFDWSRQVDTTDPNYYKWTQKLFLQFFKHGLAYKKNQPINWCPKDKIGLANEEVVNGNCERCGTPVEKRNKEQWMLAITKYADKLLDGLKNVDYIERARLQQENWIGKSEGAEVDFPLRMVPGQTDDKHFVKIFTTRPDTIFGATFLAVSPELAKSWLDIGWQASEEVKKYITQALEARTAVTAREEQEKTGISAGIVAINPVSKKEIPVWITNYVMGEVGTGAIMGVPAHDQRDFDFAKKFGLPVKQVVMQNIVVAGAAAPREGKDLVQRKVVTGIIHNPKNDTFLLLRRADKESSFVGGTIENGEDAITALRREIVEETGYTDFEIKSTSFPNFFGNGYKLRIDKNCLDFEYFYAVELKSEDRQEVSKEELAKHEPFLVPRAEVSKTITLTMHQYMWKYYTEEKPKYLIFDFDGVIGNTFEACAKAQMVIDNKSKEEAVEAMTRYFSSKPNHAKGHSLTEIEMVAKLDWTRRFGEEMAKLEYSLFSKFNKEIKNIPNTKVAIISAGSGLYIRNRIEETGLNPSHVLTFEDHHSKEEKIEQVCKDWGVSMKDVYYFTDSKADVYELEDCLDRKKIIGCAWGYCGYDLLRELLPENQVLKNPEDIHLLFADSVYENEGVAVESEFLNGLKTPEAKQKMISWLEENRIGKKQINYKLRDWVFSRQRYWGEPIPLVHCEKCSGWVPLPEDELPLKLPKVEKYQPTDNGESPLAAMEKWVKTKCPNCGGPARRETDTMPNWAGSSWYFLAYAMGGEKRLKEKGDKFWDKEMLKHWQPVDWYNGGMEHTVLHLLYSRFWNQFLYDIGMVPTPEPYAKRTSHGMILAKGGEKMSKSKGNVVNPDEMVEQFGADALRAYIMFMGPFDQAVEWDTNGLVGVKRFLDKVWNLQEKVENKITDTKIETALHQTIKKVTEDIDAMRFNTAIAKMMELVNEMSKADKISVVNYTYLVQILAPFAPHLCEELWDVLGHEKSLACESWPQFNPELIKESEVTLAVQVNGKLRDTITVAADISEEEAKRTALSSEAVKKWLEGKEPKKVIYVKGKLVSVVV